MTKTLTIQLPDYLERQLTDQAQRLNVSLESLIVQSLAQSVNLGDTVEADPILPLLGTLKFENSDVGENHDKYLSQSLQQELNLAE